MTARPRNALRHLLLPLVAAPLLIAIILRPDPGLAGVDYDLNCVLDRSRVTTPPPPDTPTPPINPTPGSCQQAEEGNPCVGLGDACNESNGGSAACDRTGSASCIDGACNVTAYDDQILSSGGYLDWFSNWFTTPDGAWEIRYYRSPVCQNSSGIDQCSTYQIRAAAATPPDTPGEGGGGGVIPPPGATPTPTPILGNIRVRGLSTETYQTLSCPEVRALTSGITGAQFRVDGPMRHSGAKLQVLAAGMM